MFEEASERRQRERAMREAGRLPPGQSLTMKWPVLHAGTVPRFDPSHLGLSAVVQFDRSRAMAAGVTSKLWEMGDMVKALEDWELARISVTTVLTK